MSTRALRTSTLLVCLLLSSSFSTASAQCADWTSGYELSGIDGDVYASALFDDGSGNGPELYLGGQFQAAGEVAARNIAKWNGQRWAAVGGGRPGRVNALLVWDDGSGPALYAGCDGFEAVPASGTLTTLARWNGTTWTGAPGGVAITEGVQALAIYDEGSGPRLFVRARFTSIPGAIAVAHLIGRFDGSAWSTVGAGLYSDYQQGATMVVHDDGNGPKLFVGGYSLRPSPTGPQGPVWNWDGSTWTRVSGGWFNGATCHTLAIVHDPNGAEILYGGGDQSTLAPGNQLMRWNGTSWNGVGAVLTDRLYALIEVPQPGSGGLLYAGGGSFTFLGIATGGVAVWNGAQWSNAPAPLLASARTFQLYDEGGGAKLFAGLGPVIYFVSNQAVRGVARLDASAWNVPGPAGAGQVGTPLDLLAFDDGSGSALYAAGTLAPPFPQPASQVVRFDGQSWTPLPGTFSGGEVTVLQAQDDGVHGRELYAAGTFTQIGSQPANRIARWDGTSWAPLGAGLGFVFAGWTPRVYDMTTWDDGSGPRLVVVGDFDLAGGAPARFVAQWDGTTWTPLGPGTNNQVYAVATFDDGSGPALYVAGIFHHAGGIPALAVARWNGSLWSAVGSGLPGAINLLTVHDDGAGPQLYAAGNGAMHRWNGTVWQTLPGANNLATSLASYDDGTGGGPQLYFSGGFTSIGGVPAAAIARWNGSTWQALGAGLDRYANALAVWDDGSGPALFAGGLFTRSGSWAASRVARFGPTNAAGCTAVTGTAYCFGDGTGTACPCGNSGLAGHGCASAANAQGATLLAEGQAHLSSDTVTLRAAGMPPTTTLLFFQGTGQTAGGLGVPFGDGLRCVNGTLVRLAIRSASGGAASFGHAVAGDPSLSAAGHLPASWTTRNYQAWYRDAQSFCTSALYNLTNGVSIRWAP